MHTHIHSLTYSLTHLDRHNHTNRYKSARTYTTLTYSSSHWFSRPKSFYSALRLGICAFSHHHLHRRAAEPDRAAMSAAPCGRKKMCNEGTSQGTNQLINQPTRQPNPTQPGKYWRGEREGDDDEVEEGRRNKNDIEWTFTKCFYRVFLISVAHP